jgi:hypothetical protein
MRAAASVIPSHLFRKWLAMAPNHLPVTPITFWSPTTSWSHLRSRWRPDDGFLTLWPLASARRPRHRLACRPNVTRRRMRKMFTPKPRTFQSSGGGLSQSEAASMKGGARVTAHCVDGAQVKGGWAKRKTATSNSVPSGEPVAALRASGCDGATLGCGT